MGKYNGINITRLSKYNFDYISIEEVLVLEYLVQYHLKNMLDLVVPNRIEIQTGIRRTKIDNALNALSEKKFISINLVKRRPHYTIHFDNIVNQLSKIFVKENRYGYQYYIAIQNPNAIKSKKSKLAIVQSDKNKTTNIAPKSKTKGAPKQISLFD
ncbi:MAG: hypothetical protein NW207_06695 [Cytophagales bacterium]|nr:hypothetical protein [Cytophagales bacterium]